MKPPTFRRIDLTGAEFLASLPAPLEAQLSATLEGEPFRVTAAWRGGFAHTYLLELERSGRRLVLKQLHTPGISPIGYEAELFERAARELAGEPALFPTCLAVLQADAMLLEFVPGLHVRAAIRRWRLDGVEVAAAVHAALERFYGLTGNAFADFHPSNVLVKRDRSVILLDPAPPRTDGGDHRDRRITDLAIWTHSTGVYLPWDIAASPRTAWQMVKLNATLVALVLSGAAPGLGLRPAEVEKATNAYVARLLTLWPRDKVLWLGARCITWAVCRSAARKLRRHSNPA